MMALLGFLSLCVFPSSDIRGNILHKFTETSMEPPCWCTSAVRLHCGRKILQTSGTYFGYLGD